MAIHIKKSRRGLLRKKLGVAKGENIPVERLKDALHSKSEALRKQAQFAENARHWKH